MNQHEVRIFAHTSDEQTCNLKESKFIKELEKRLSSKSEQF